VLIKTCCLIFISRSWFAETSSENCTIDLTESPRSGAGDSISSSKISNAMEATSSSPLARHCLDIFKILGTKSRNILTYIMYTHMTTTLASGNASNGIFCKTKHETKFHYASRKWRIQTFGHLK